jgi:NmrA-like family
MQPNPAMAARGWQVLQVSYDSVSDLQFKLAGVDTVISTISGSAQLALIDAAAAAHVRRFVPSEFEGSPTARPVNDIFDCGRRAALSRLQHYESQGMKFTVFSCGLFYERFGPGGMRAYQIGLRSAIGGEGEYIMDIRNCKAMIPYFNSAGQPVYVCMMSARDVARFVVAALDLSYWPRELRMKGERMAVSDVVSIGEALRGKEITPSLRMLC